MTRDSLHPLEMLKKLVIERDVYTPDTNYRHDQYYMAVLKIENVKFDSKMSNKEIVKAKKRP